MQITMSVRGNSGRMHTLKTPNACRFTPSLVAPADDIALELPTPSKSAVNIWSVFNANQHKSPHRLVAFSIIVLHAATVPFNPYPSISCSHLWRVACAAVPGQLLSREAWC
jgi:hypothetical protein